MKKIIKTPHAPAAIGPYSQAVIANGLLYTSGQIAIRPETAELESGIENQTHQVMKNLKALLEEAGTDFSEVIKTTIFLADMSDFEKVNDLYASYFPKGHYPAKETVAVKTLPKNASVEISMIARVST